MAESETREDYSADHFVVKCHCNMVASAPGSAAVPESLVNLCGSKSEFASLLAVIAGGKCRRANKLPMPP
jgi:hypothetical protein